MRNGTPKRGVNDGQEELVRQRVSQAGTSLLALFLAVAVGGPGAAQTARASISIVGLPASAVDGSPVALLVTVRDETGAPMKGYTGTVHFSSSRPGAAVPEDYTFKPGDHGSHRFSFTPGGGGAVTVSVSDAEMGLYGAETTTVEAIPAVVSAVVPAVSNVTPAERARPTADAVTASATIAAPAAGSDAAPAAVTASAVRATAPPASHLYFVAHQDDDLLFMN